MIAAGGCPVATGLILIPRNLTLDPIRPRNSLVGTQLTVRHIRRMNVITELCPRDHRVHVGGEVDLEDATSPVSIPTTHQTHATSGVTTEVGIRVFFLQR